MGRFNTQQSGLTESHAMEIPYHKPYIGEEEVSEVVGCLKSGWLTMGPKTMEFEERFREYIGASYTISLNSCTAALHLALKAIDLKPGDEVILPTMTFTSTGEVVTYFGATPVLVDIERATHNVDVKEIEKRITPRTRAIIPVHFAGQPCDMEEITALAGKHGIYVIEDAAHALPAWYGERKIGTIGDITCFSFYATKTLSTGEGGMATTDDELWACRMRTLRCHGISKDGWKRYSKDGSWYYEVLEAGYKYNITDIESALGLAQLRKLEWMWEARDKIASLYTKAFAPLDGVITPFVKPDRKTAWHLYTIKLNLEALNIDRAMFIDELKLRGIGTSVHFIPLHRHPFYRNCFGCSAADFPHAEWVYERVISLPIFPSMTQEEVYYVIDVIADLCDKWAR